ELARADLVHDHVDLTPQELDEARNELRMADLDPHAARSSSSGSTPTATGRRARNAYPRTPVFRYLREPGTAGDVELGGQWHNTFRNARWSHAAARGASGSP